MVSGVKRSLGISPVVEIQDSPPKKRVCEYVDFSVPTVNDTETIVRYNIGRDRQLALVRVLNEGSYKIQIGRVIPQRAGDPIEEFTWCTNKVITLSITEGRRLKNVYLPAINEAIDGRVHLSEPHLFTRNLRTTLNYEWAVVDIREFFLDRESKLLKPMRTGATLNFSCLQGLGRGLTDLYRRDELAVYDTTCVHDNQEAAYECVECCPVSF